MKIERTKNAKKNIAAGLVLKLYQMAVPFLMRTAMIYFMGVQYLGLHSLFTSILQILNLAELGVGSAMVFSMYKPIAEDDERTICALMGLYRKYYRMIGLFIGVVGLAMTPVIPRLISGEVPADLSIYVLYWLNLGATVLTYWLFAYKNSLLQAHQRTDMVSMVTLVTNTVQYAIQLLIVIFWKNYYAYAVVALATQAASNILTAVVSDRMYPNYKPVGTLSKEETGKINGRIRDLFTGKLGSVVLNSADTVVISAFLGLTVLAIYQNYYFILTCVLGMIEIVFASIIAGLGNTFVVETREKNYEDLQKFTFLFMWLVGVCTCCFLGLYQPFMEIWVGEELMLGFAAVVCFSVYFFVYTLNRLLNVYKDAAGLWHEDRFRPLLTSITNLTLNLLLVHKWGIYGVLLSTVISMVVVGMPWLMHNLFTLFFQPHQLKSYLKQIAGYIAVTATSGVLVVLACYGISAEPWLKLVVCGMICVTVPNLLFFIVFRKKALFAQGKQFVVHMARQKLRSK